MSILFIQASDLWNKRHSVAIGDVHECKLIRRKEITGKQVDHIWKSMTAAQYVQRAHTHTHRSGWNAWSHCSYTPPCCGGSLQRVLGLASLDGVLNPAHVSGKHIIHNVFNVNKSGIVVLENKAGVASPHCSVPGGSSSLTSFLSAEDMPYWVVSAMKCLANCKFDAATLVALFV